MTDKYYRLVTILVNICPDPLRELFLKQAAADPDLQTQYTTLDAYLAFRRKDINNLTQKPKCVLRKDQFHLLFPPGQSQSDISTWDVTLLSTLLTHIFTLSKSDSICIKKIREIRNQLQHIAGTSKITEQYFKQTYKDLSVNIVNLASSVKGQGYADKVDKDIKEVESSVLTDLGDVLRSWYMDRIVTLETEVKNIKDQTDNIKIDTGKTMEILKNTTVRRTRDGTIMKRMKIEDPVIDKMKGNFASLLKNKLDRDSTPPPETEKIIKEIRDNHLVVVSGYDKGLYLQAALSAIDSQGYEAEECILCSSPANWNCFGKEDAKLVVFLHPFGESAFDLQKARDFFSIADDIVETTVSGDDDDAIDVVIIIDQSVPDEWKCRFEQDMMKQPIIVCKPTTEDSPVDLIEGGSIMSQVEADPHYKNLLVQSIAYNKHHRAKMADDNIRESALEAFRSKKVIVISGPRCSGKTTLALSLLSSYQDGHYLILTEPDDISCIRFGVTSVVIIEDLGGKYMFEMSVNQKWLRKFDMLYSAVKDGKLNVIITFLTDRLSSCVHESKHPMLETVIELPKDCSIHIKKESSTDCNSVVYAGKRTNVLSNKRVRRIQTHTIEKHVNLEMSDDWTKELCQHPDGSFLFLAYISSVYDNKGYSINTTAKIKTIIIHITSDFKYKCHYNTDIRKEWHIVIPICCTDTGNVVISVTRQIRLYRISGESLQLIKFTDVEFECTNISFLKNMIYCFTSGTSLILDRYLNIKRTEQLLKINVQNILPCSLQTYVSILYNDDFNECEDFIICEDSRLKQLKYLRKEGFEPMCICAACEDSVFICGRQAQHFKILHVNTDMAVLSEICTINEKDIDPFDMLYIHKIVFDKNKSRFIICSDDDNDNLFHTLYFE